jgi:hypothetical protein
LKIRRLLAAVGVLTAAYGILLAVSPVQLIAQACGDEGCIALGPVTVLGLALGTPIVILGLVAIAYGLSGREAKASD